LNKGFVKLFGAKLLKITSFTILCPFFIPMQAYFVLGEKEKAIIFDRF